MVSPGTGRGHRRAQARRPGRPSRRRRPHILLADGTDVDLVLARWKWESDIITRAETLTVAEGVRIRVPRTADLILLKLAAGGFMDLRDAAALLEIAGRDVVPEIEGRIGEVRPDIRGAWRELLASSS